MNILALIKTLIQKLIFLLVMNIFTTINMFSLCPNPSIFTLSSLIVFYYSLFD
jgi:hypothetical protein